MAGFRIDGPEVKEKSHDMQSGLQFNPDKRIEVGPGEIGRASAEATYNPDSRIRTEGDAEVPEAKGDKSNAAIGKLGDSETKSPESIKDLVNAYLDDLKSRSPFPETLAYLKLDPQDLHVANPEETKKLRTEFADKNSDECKNNLIEDWQKKMGKEWPRYKEDVSIATKGGETVVIRHAGDRYDAHHIQPLSLGGKNTVDNITPMDARDHFDSRGIHEPDGTCDKLAAALKEV